MTDDIVARLREYDGRYGFRGDIHDAADEIERLRSERDAARAELCFVQAEDPVAYAVSRGWHDIFREEP